MAELIREIEKEDLPKIEELIKLVFKTDGTYKDIKRLGGMTNHSYKITLDDGKEYLMRIPGEGTEDMINREDERKSTELACELGLDSKLLFFSEDGRKVMEFIHDPQEMNADVMKKKENMSQAADIFRTLHRCGKDTGVRFEVFEMCDSYEKIILDNNVKLYDDYFDVKNEVMKFKAEVDADGETSRVPCHNDSLLGNWILDGDGKLYLVDWEYSGMNEYMWDLSCLSIESDYDEENDDDLLRLYYQREFSDKEKKYFIAAKMYVDLLWTLWGLTRVPFDGDFMQEYADERYERLKSNIEKYKNLG